jgi:response regulator RpfG family c-di-GMP phosphodiesterase
MTPDAAAESCCLLIVDDEVRILAALRRSLRREGYVILTAESGEAALQLLAERSIDIVLSDHKMPGMSGVELLTAVVERSPRTSRILITGWTEAVPPETLEALGVAALIPKPWEDHQLKDTLRAVAGTRLG